MLSTAGGGHQDVFRMIHNQEKLFDYLGRTEGVIPEFTVKWDITFGQFPFHLISYS